MQAQSVTRMPLALRRRRRWRVIDARFQWKVTLVFTGVVVGLGAVLSALLVHAQRVNTRLLELETIPRLQQEVVRGDRLLLLGLVAFLAVLGLVLVAWTLVWTHRISGPVRVVKRHLAALGQGCLPELRPLRKHDELHELFATLESAVEAMRRRQVQQLELIGVVVAAAQSRAEAGDCAGALQVALDGLVEQRDAVASSLAVRLSAR